MEFVSQVTIVGGGTAGWLTAALLQRLLNPNPKKKPSVAITLIESPNIATVGVGEATVPNMPLTLSTIGLSEQEFFKHCNASFKLGVLFGHWNVDTAGKPVDYINPFARGKTVAGIEVGQYYRAFGGGAMDFTDAISPSVQLLKSGKGPRPLGARPYDNSVGFAYHLDAGKFAGLLRDRSVAMGVTHILDDVNDVTLDAAGNVASLELAEGGTHPVELVVDCTGFRGLIINQALKEPFISYSKYLANDRAMAVQIPHPDKERIDPVTKATALGAGWSWRVPLYNRIGTGYVFSSAHRTDEEAMDEFRAHLGMPKAEPRVIPMRVGRNRNAWVKNCVAVGLSGGFIEPLESTAIHMIDASIRWLVNYFPTKDFPDAMRDRFNREVGGLYDEVLDFITLHYALGNRTDTAYWKDTRTELTVPDRLAENLEVWKYGLPQPQDIGAATLFSHATYQVVLLGKQVYENGYGHKTHKLDKQLSRSAWQDYLRKAKAQWRHIDGACVPHRALLRDIRGEAQAPLAGINLSGIDVPTAGGVPADAASLL